MKKVTKTLLFSGVLMLSTAPIYSQSIPKDEFQKKEWIHENKTSYNNLGGQTTVEPEFNTREAKLAYYKSLYPNQVLPNGDIYTPKKDEKRTTVILSSEPTFPVYVSTGNQEADDAGYLQKKLDWISQNPDKYNQMVQTASNPIPQKDRLQLDIQPKK